MGELQFTLRDSGAIIYPMNPNRIDMKRTIPFYNLATAGFLSLSGLASGAISYVRITNDADSGISTDNTYTHTLDFDTTTTGVTVNGVVFSGYNLAANGTLNFNRTIANGSLNHNAGTGIINATGNVTGLMGGFLFNNGPAIDGSGLQTYNISGLTAGTTYDARIYSSQWRDPPSRPNTLVFDPDGAGAISDSTGLIDQDDPTTVGLATGDAYYINYRYTAVAGENLVITVANQSGSNASWHLYGFTNQVVVPEPSGTALLGLGGLALMFRRRRG